MGGGEGGKGDKGGVREEKVRTKKQGRQKVSENERGDKYGKLKGGK